MFQVVNNLSRRAGAHALGAGIDVLYNDDTITFLRTFRGSYTFSSLARLSARWVALECSPSDGECGLSCGTLGPGYERPADRSRGRPPTCSKL